MREACGKATTHSPYGYKRTWNAALRFIRVDNGFDIVEKDDSTGYILFEYRSPESGSKPVAGSLEVVQPPSDSNDVAILVSLPKMPHYHERVLADGLTRKMRDEYGDPPPRPKESPKREKRKRDDDESSDKDAGS